MAIGDQWNDVEMLGEVGHGAAMPTAPVEVRAAARYEAPPLADEGVAVMIETLVLADPERARIAGDRLAEEARAARDASDAEDVAERRRAAAAESTDADARTGSEAEDRAGTSAS